jgi:hypothetical protein
MHCYKDYPDETDVSMDFDSLYDYSSPPIMPGVRKLCGVPEEKHIVKGLNDVKYNFFPHEIPAYNNPKCIAPFYMNEGFGNSQSFLDLLLRLVIFIILVAFIWYLITYGKFKD